MFFYDHSALHYLKGIFLNMRDKHITGDDTICVEKSLIHHLYMSDDELVISCAQKCDKFQHLICFRNISTNKTLSF